MQVAYRAVIYTGSLSTSEQRSASIPMEHSQRVLLLRTEGGFEKISPLAAVFMIVLNFFAARD